jgi:multiple sugar transport system substrate-binding protein
MRSRSLIAVVAVVATVTTLAACSSSSSSKSATGAKTISVAYQKFGAFVQMDQHMQKVKTQFEAANPGVTVKLVPIQADENSYYTKLNLMSRSASTAPDVLYEDTFLVNSDVAAGYLASIDDEVSKWADWNQFSDAAKSAGKGEDGKTYGVPMGTDTRGLYYNKQIFAKAGLPADWQPKTWDDLLSAARTVKQKVPGVTPLNVYSGKGAGEGSTMQGFEMLLYGTKNALYDDASKKWIVTSQGMTDSMNFIKTVFGEKLGPDPQDALDPQFGTKLSTSLLPEGKLAIALDGSWQTGTWKSTGSKPWPQYAQVLGTAAMPTQNGDAPGKTSMSGGWLLSIGSKSKNKDAAWKFISLALNKDNTKSYDMAASQIAERKDVADDPEYKSSDPTTPFFTSLVDVTHFRPAYTAYPKVSDAIQVAMEAVMTGQASPDKALSQYAESVKRVVGADKTATG